VWREGIHSKEWFPLSRSAFRRVLANCMAAPREYVDLEGEQSPWKDRLHEPSATSACSANSSMEQRLEVGCSTSSLVRGLRGNAEVTSWKWRCATWKPMLRQGRPGGSSNDPLALRCGGGVWQGARCASWSSESGWSLATGSSTGRPSGSAAALIVRSRTSVRLVAVHRGGSRISVSRPLLRKKPAGCFTPCSMLEERLVSAIGSAGIILTARSPRCVGSQFRLGSVQQVAAATWFAGCG